MKKTADFVASEVKRIGQLLQHRQPALIGRYTDLRRNSDHPVHPSPRAVFLLLPFNAAQQLSGENFILDRTNPHGTANLNGKLRHRGTRWELSLTCMVEPHCSQMSPFAFPCADLNVCTGSPRTFGFWIVRPRGCNAVVWQ